MKARYFFTSLTRISDLAERPFSDLLARDPFDPFFQGTPFATHRDSGRDKLLDLLCTLLAAVGEQGRECRAAPGQHRI